MATNFQFTEDQIAHIATLRNQLREKIDSSFENNQSQIKGAVPLYSYVFECVTV